MKLSNIKIGNKLAAGFALLLVFVVAAAAIGWSAMSATKAHLDTIVNENEVKTKLAMDMRNAVNSTSLVQRNMLLYKDAEYLKTGRERVAQRREEFDAASKKLQPMLQSEEGKKTFAAIVEHTEAQRPLSNAIMELLQAGKVDEAVDHLRNKVQPVQSKRMKAIDEMVALQEKLTAQAVKDANASHQRGVTLLIVAIVVSLVLGIIVAWLTTRSVTRPLARAVATADAVAAGNLDNTIDATATDETGHLLAAMSRMQESIRKLVAAQAEMKDRHEEGNISHRIDVSQFAGSYAEVARNTNELVAAHIAVMMRLAQVGTAYGNGDLSAEMDRLPGEKAQLTNAMDQTRNNLKAISDQIQNLVDAARRGDFTVRGDETQFDHDFRRMVGGLNQLMQTSEQGLNEVSRVLGALAKGDLTETITNQYQGTFGKLKDDSNKTVENLTSIVHQIKEASETIDTASKEITQGNTDLSQRTEEQASSLEETASSMEELTSTVKQNAENARQANQLAVGASDVAVKGGQVVGQVVATMSGISESSKKIADIIGTIDGIAFQTNILALNAAVEAARAGEQGRGFAVVATEVRNLAQRSANAAKEIKELITDSVNRVDTGSRLVEEAGQTMEEIVTSVKRVTDIMAEITAASQEQSSGIEQVNQAITQMDEVTQQNAALVEQAAAAAESMQEQSGNLVQAVAQFRLAASAQAERRSPSRATNVARIAAKPAAAKTERKPVVAAPAGVSKKVVGSDEDWQEF